jgi:hypothetical protein
MDQLDLFETSEARSLLDQLITDSRLYTSSDDFKKLLQFVVRLRNFAPFNAMLLQLQKPGLSYAASARDWRDRFNRCPVEGARPLLILWPFGPVALVYDVQDTEGDQLPEDVNPFIAHGDMDDKRMEAFLVLLGKKNIQHQWIDAGDGKAGSITLVGRAADSKSYSKYRMAINTNHAAPVKFSTLAHELGHLLLGHLGNDPKLKIPKRTPLTLAQRELEAESVAYLVCERNGVSVKSETYLSTYVTKNSTLGELDLYQVMRAAGQVEAMLGLTAHTKYDKPPLAKKVSSSGDTESLFGSDSKE